MKYSLLLFLFSAPLFCLSAKAQSGVPVYDSFEELAPVFNKDNDTTYVINFWATWCKPCVEELPYIEQIHDAYPNEKVKVILVSLDFPNQIESKLLPFIEKNELQSDVVVLLDGKYNSWIDRVDNAWDGAIPVTLIYKADKRHFINTAFHSFEELDEILKGFIK
ncbi:MAG: redoxin domain-containing protein [Bacteroidetes bacterium]|nr:redoxin domain-containing protein [Bacteroidota bacterium]